MTGKLIILQLLAHLVSDFYLQTEKSCKNKADNAFKSKHLYIHALITFACAYLFSMSLGFWWAALLIAVLHLITDGLKSIFRNLKWAFFYDQILHLIVIFATVAFFDKTQAVSIPEWMPSTDILLWIAAFVFCLRPANFFIQAVFSNAKIQVPDNENNNLPNAGHVIGNVERILTLVFVMINQFEAIGFLLAAKSLLRFRETDTMKSEYVLVGTLLSFALAILVGLLTQYLIKTNCLV